VHNTSGGLIFEGDIGDEDGPSSVSASAAGKELKEMYSGQVFLATRKIYFSLSISLTVICLFILSLSTCFSPSSSSCYPLLPFKERMATALAAMKNRCERAEAVAVVLQSESRSLQSQLKTVMGAVSDGKSAGKTVKEVERELRFQQQLDALETENIQLRAKLANSEGQVNDAKLFCFISL